MYLRFDNIRVYLALIGYQSSTYIYNHQSKEDFFCEEHYCRNWTTKVVSLLVQLGLNDNTS